jgi:hypothetical protein
MSKELKKEFFFCPKYGKADRCPMVKSPDTELVEVLEDIVRLAEQQTFNEVMDNPCGAYDMFTELDSIASEAITKYKEKPNG